MNLEKLKEQSISFDEFSDNILKEEVSHVEYFVIENENYRHGSSEGLQKEIEDNKLSKEDWEIEEYLISQYNVYQDENYLTHESQIEDRFKDIGSEYLECGQGYCQEEATVIVKIGKKFYNVTIWAEIGSAKQDRGDRLYWVEKIDRVTYEEIEKPKFKEELYYIYKIKLNKDTKILLENLLKENSFEFEVE